MMELDGIRRGLGDESLVWTRLCGRFRDVEREANRWGLGGRWRELLAAVRAGAPNALDWQLLLAELAELRDGEDDFIGRDGLWPVTTAEDADPASHGCPAGLCRRREVAGPAAPPPRCDLLAADMVDPIG